MDVHNQRRAQHCVPRLEWSPRLATAAQAWADHLAATSTFAHSPQAISGEYGENLESDTGGTLTDTARADLWYHEAQGYDWNNPGYALPGYNDPVSGGAIGHFTAMVWKATEAVGCGKATNGATAYLVCNYGPAGNVAGDYARNVLPVCAP